MILLAKKINFPLDSVAYLRKGKSFLREGKNEEALDSIKKAYGLNSDIQTNLFYAMMLSRFERYEDALEIMDQEKSMYVNDEIHAIFYTKTLVKTQRFIEAEYIIQKYKHDPKRIDERTWENLEQDLIDEREKANLEASVRRERIKKSLRELEQYSHMVQVRKVRNAEILDLSELQEVAPIILVSNDISGTVQRYFLELLIHNGDQNVYSFQWFNQLRTVCPAELPKFDEIELFHVVLEAIGEKLTKYPDLKDRVTIEMMHDLLLLYPYIEETIKDVDFWVDAYISELDFFNHVKIKRIVATEEQQEMMKWINYLNTIAQRDQMFTD